MCKAKIIFKIDRCLFPEKKKPGMFFGKKRKKNLRTRELRMSFKNMTLKKGVKALKLLINLFFSCAIVIVAEFH